MKKKCRICDVSTNFGTCCFICSGFMEQKKGCGEDPEPNGRERTLLQIIGEQQKTLTTMYVCFGSLIGIFVICGIIEYLY